MNFNCPKCNRAVYNRRLKTCGYCGAELPKEFQLTQAELDESAKRDAAADARLKSLKVKDAEEELQRRKKESGLGNLSHLM